MSDGFQNELERLRRRVSELEAVLAGRASLSTVTSVGGLHSQSVPPLGLPEEFLKLQFRVLECMVEGVSVSDENGHILYTNPAEDRMFGYEPGELIGRHVTVLNAYPPQRNEVIVAGVIEKLKTAGSWSGEWLNRKKDGTTFSTFARITALQLGGRNYWVCVQEDITEVRRTQESRQETERQLTLLAQASGALLASPTPQEVLKTILDLAQRFIKAEAYAVWRKVPDREEWRLVASLGLSENYEGSIRNYGSGWSLPAQPIAIEDVEESLLVGHRANLYRAEGIRSILTVPLRIDGAVTGTIVFYYRSPHRFSDGEKMIAGALGNLAAAALGIADMYDRQSQLRALAERAERRAAFLAEAGEVLASSLDYETTLAAVAKLAVPFFADWSSVDIVDDGGEVRRVAVAHFDPAMIASAYEFHRRYPPLPDEPGPVALRTGTSRLVAEIPDEVLVRRARDPEHLAIVRALGLKSVILAPMVARGRTLGLLSFVVTDESGRKYSQADLELAEELARRAALAVDNARLHKEVRESEDRLRRAIEDAPIPIMIHADNGDVLYLSKAWTAITGYSREELPTTRAWVDRAFGERAGEAYRIISQTYAITDPQEHDSEFEIAVKGGEKRIWVISSAPLGPVPGGLRLAVTAATDITERKRAADALEESTATIQALLESASQAILTVSADGSIVSVNAMVERMFGYQRGELLGQMVEMLIPAHSRGRHVGHRAGFHREPRSRPMGAGLDLTARRKDGSEFPVEISLSHVRTKSGGLAVSFITDITGRKMAEAALRESEQRFRRIVETAAEGIWTVDMKGRTTFANERLANMLECTVEELQDTSSFDFVFEEDRGEALARFQMYARTNQPPFDFRLRKKNGTAIWVSISASPLHDDRGEPLGVLAMFTDITSRKRVQEALLAANRSLERSNEDLRQFAYAASHDLQEPLRMVTAYSQLLARRYRNRLDADGIQYVDFAVEGARRIEDLLSDLRQYWQVSRLDQKEASPASSLLALHTALENLRSAVRESGASITWDELPSVVVHEVALVQLFQNLIGNAMKYRRGEEPAIHISCVEEGGYCRFSVADNGIGIEKRYHEQIFGIFKRLHGSDIYSGTGIGLAICQKIVQRYGGRIWVESEQGKGSIFHFTLPAAG